MKNIKILLIFVLLFSLFFVILLFAVFLLLRNSNQQNNVEKFSGFPNSRNNFDEEKNIVSEPNIPIKNENSTNNSSTNNSIHNTEVLKNFIKKASKNIKKDDFKKAQRIQLGELELILEVIEALYKKGWDQNIKNPLPISKNDLDFSKIQNIIKNELNKDRLKQPGKEYEDILYSKQAEKEIKIEIEEAMKEFLDYLYSKNISEKYIEEFKNVLPLDFSRITYYPTKDFKKGPTGVSPLIVDKEKIYSKYVLKVYAPDIFNAIQNIYLNSGLLGNIPTKEEDYQIYLKTLRYISLKQLLYHEFVHVLQQAYVNIHFNTNYKESNKGSFYHSTKTPVDFDNFKYWGLNSEFVLEKDIALESQAEGISYAVTSEILGFTEIQKEILWEYYFGRYDLSNKLLSEFRDKLNKFFPKLSVLAFTSKIYDLFYNMDINYSDKGVLLDLAMKLDLLGAYPGYFNPILPKDLDDKFWRFFKD